MPRPRLTLAALLLAACAFAIRAPLPAGAQTPPRPTVEQLKQAMLDPGDLGQQFSVMEEGPRRSGMSYARVFTHPQRYISNVPTLVAELADATAHAPAELAEAFIRSDAGRPNTVVERVTPPELGHDAIRFTVRPQNTAALGLKSYKDAIAWRHEGVTVLVALWLIEPDTTADATLYALKQQAKLAAAFRSAPETLGAGCTTLSSTWPDGTTPAAIAAAVSPPGALVAIWRAAPAGGAFRGWSPAGVWATDLSAINRGDRLLLCTVAAATLTR